MSVLKREAKENHRLSKHPSDQGRSGTSPVAIGRNRKPQWRKEKTDSSGNILLLHTLILHFKLPVICAWPPGSKTTRLCQLMLIRSADEDRKRTLVFIKQYKTSANFQRKHICQ